jgi:hypothetical protein
MIFFGWHSKAMRYPGPRCPNCITLVSYFSIDGKYLSDEDNEPIATSPVRVPAAYISVNPIPRTILIGHETKRVSLVQQMYTIIHLPLHPRTRQVLSFRVTTCFPETGRNRSIARMSVRLSCLCCRLTAGKLPVKLCTLSGSDCGLGNLKHVKKF